MGALSKKGLVGAVWNQWEHEIPAENKCHISMDAGSYVPYIAASVKLAAAKLFQTRLCHL